MFVVDSVYILVIGNLKKPKNQKTKNPKNQKTEKPKNSKMRLYIIVLFITIASNTFGQTDFNLVLKNVQTISLPYTTEQGKNAATPKRKVLNPMERRFIFDRLKSKSPKVINEYGVSPFGQMDCKDTTDCLQFDSMKEVAISFFIPMTNGRYLLHLELNDESGLSTGILASINEKGDLQDWFFSDGSVTSGNPHGQVGRDFTIQKDKTILINEGSWGDNTITYGFKAKLKMVLNADASNTVYEDGDFELKSISINFDK
ncbi:MAG: hypothetical protein JWQ25_3333 [Daejeonella sp.]|nr:hypothetical protein [Daejeonella sp.]